MLLFIILRETGQILDTNNDEGQWLVLDEGLNESPFIFFLNFSS